MAIKNELPQRICLLEAGENPSSKGPCVYTPELADKFNQFSQKLSAANRRLSFDRDHLQLSEDTSVDAKKSYGRFILKADETGLFADEIEWTESAEKLISSGEYECFSIAALINPETKEIEELLNVALTNLPADSTASLWKTSPLLLTLSQTHNRDESQFIVTNSRALFQKETDMKKELIVRAAEEDKKDDEEVVVEEETRGCDSDVEKREEDLTEEVVSEDTEEMSLEDLKAENEALKDLVEELKTKLAALQDKEVAAVEDEEMLMKRSIISKWNSKPSVKALLLRSSLEEVKNWDKLLNKNSEPRRSPTLRNSNLTNDVIVESTPLSPMAKRLADVLLKK